jgi:rRNA maturation endonuclease Nob1
MALAETKYVVLSDDGFTKTPWEDRLETLRSWLVRCPNCDESHLVVGARENEPYTCKDCGHTFAIRISVDANDLSDDESDSQ